MSVSRRKFVKSAATAGITVAASVRQMRGQTMTDACGPGEPARQPIFMATWPFGRAVVERAVEVLRGAGSLLDAIEQGIRVAESDRDNASVGVGGAPNADGVVQLDACIMSGGPHRAGAVAALEGFPHPISVARRVMEKTPHVLLVGAGARQFAREQGFTEAALLTEERKREWQEWKMRRRPAVSNHDTITLLGCDGRGTLAGGCSTSGWAYKLPGRVGDSPIIGSGLYVDNDVGAAGATGLGENVMQYCLSFLTVELMRGGTSPAEACAEAIQRMLRKERPRENPSVNLIAMNRAGQVGAAGTDAAFRFAIATPDGARIESPRLLPWKT